MDNKNLLSIKSFIYLPIQDFFAAKSKPWIVLIRLEKNNAYGKAFQIQI